MWRRSTVLARDGVLYGTQGGEAAPAADCRRVGGTQVQKVARTLSTGGAFGSTIISDVLDWGHIE